MPHLPGVPAITQSIFCLVNDILGSRGLRSSIPYGASYPRSLDGGLDSEFSQPV